MVLGILGSGMASRVAPRLWQGGFPAVSPEEVRRRGFDVVVLCAEELQPDRADVAAWWESSRVRLILAPMNDTDDREELPRVVGVASRAAGEVVLALDRGDRVLVTCAQGRNRSGLVSALALVRRCGVSGREAARVVREARPSALTNALFREFLDGVPAVLARAHGGV